MLYLGKEYSKREIMAYAGNIRQLAGIDRVRLDDGNGDGARLIQVKNASGLEFTIIESRCMDMLNLSYKGIPINYLSKNGLFYPLRTVPYDGQDTHKYLTGGMFYTCGAANVGWECEDGGVRQTNHGRMKSMSATNVSAKGCWTDDDNYDFEIYGEMRETSLFGENISLRRAIKTRFGESKLIIRDEIENESFKTQPFMYMYHMNLGFPFVDEGTEVVTSAADISCRDRENEHLIGEYGKIDPPGHPGREVCLMHDFRKKGLVVNAAINRDLGLGFYARQDTNIMPFMHEWKTNIAGAYALGMEPANCHCEGRVREREVYNTLRHIEPFEKVTVEVEIGIVEGEQQINRLIQACE